MIRNKAIEDALIWAHENGYSASLNAIHQYATDYNCGWHTLDSYYKIVKFHDKPQQQELPSLLRPQAE